MSKCPSDVQLPELRGEKKEDDYFLNHNAALKKKKLFQVKLEFMSL